MLVIDSVQFKLSTVKNYIVNLQSCVLRSSLPPPKNNPREPYPASAAAAKMITPVSIHFRIMGLSDSFSEVVTFGALHR